MSSFSDPSASLQADLRLHAEERLRREAVPAVDQTPEEMQTTLHELQVHQIELEMQNEQLRLTQSDLDQAREQLGDLYDFAPIGYLTTSAEGMIVEANLTSVKMLGVDRALLLSTPLSSLVMPQDQSTYFLCWRRVLNSDETQSCEVRFRTENTPTFYARLEGIQVRRGETSAPERCRWAISDISETVMAREALVQNERQRLQHESDEWKRLALDAGELGAWDHDLQTGMTRCSARACSMLGYPAGAEISWEGFLSRVHPDDRVTFLNQIEDSNHPNGRRRCDVVFRVVLPAGAQRWVRFVAASVFPTRSHGRPTRRTGVLADITRQKETEELLESRAKQLEALVNERTARLQEAVTELQHLSYTLVHDLRAPLRSVAGYSDLLLKECKHLNPTHVHFLERSFAAVQRMDRLILDVLNYNRIVSQDFALEPIDCAALLAELLDSYPQFSEARSHIHIAEMLPIVLGNTALITQCFSNLLNNALKFVKPGVTPEVRISAQDLGNRVRITIQDNGIGIPEESQQRVFSMFQRLDHHYEGTGIGLALVKKAVERMRGHVGFESHGQGCRFHLDLNKP